MLNSQRPFLIRNGLHCEVVSYCYLGKLNANIDTLEPIRHYKKEMVPN